MQANRMESTNKKSSITMFIDNSFIKGNYKIGEKGSIDIVGNISREDINTDTDVLTKSVKVSKINIKKFARI